MWSLPRHDNSGDANLDTITDVRDFNIWNAHKFTSAPEPAPVDAALEATLAPERTASNIDPDFLAWFYEIESASLGRPASNDASRAEAAIDRLLASYWP